MKSHFHGKNTILRHNDRKQNQFFCERTKTKKKISSANFPFKKKKKRALKFQKTRSFLSLRASGLPIFLALAGRQAIPPPSLPRPRVKISYRRAMRNFSSRMDYAESRTARGQSGGERGREGGGEGVESKRGAVAHSRVCGAADKGPSLDNYLPFARLPSVILGLETEEDRGGSGGDGDTSSIARLFRSFASLPSLPPLFRSSRSLPSCEPARRN